MVCIEQFYIAGVGDVLRDANCLITNFIELYQTHLVFIKTIAVTSIHINQNNIMHLDNETGIPGYW